MFVALDAASTDADVDPARTWAACGGQWLTGTGVPVPVRLVRQVAGVARYLDDRGAGLAKDIGARGVGLVGERAAAVELAPSLAGRSCGGGARLVRCADGWMALSLPRPDDVSLVPAWLEREVDDEVWSTVSLVALERRREDLVQRAVMLGLACTGLGETLDHRAVLVDHVGTADRRPLDGLVVANLGALWAGPLAADVLGRLGARVINVESSARPDGARARPEFFEILHSGCEFVALPLENEHGHRMLHELLERVDVVIEGSRPRALEQMGIEARSLVENGPRLWVSITAHGRSGPSAARVGFGDDAAISGGLAGFVGGEPWFVGDAIADPITGMVAAATVVQLCEMGGRWLVDIALARVAASMGSRHDDARVEPHVDSDPPRHRPTAGRPLPLGRDTRAILEEFGVSR